MKGNLAQLARQLLGIWRQLGLNQRLTVVMGSAAVLAALLALGFWSSRADYALLYGKLDDAEAAKVIGVLDESKSTYRIGAGGSIYVPNDKVHALRMQLASRGIPRGDGVGYEIFDKPNFGLSEFAQRTNFKRALQGELARTIGQLDDVESARVMIVVPENRLLADSNRKPTASVFVQLRGNTALSPQSINSIRFLVANAVEGLQVGNVSVVDNRGNVLSENTEADSLNGLSSNQLNARRNLEQYLSKKAQGMLETVLGPGQAVVRVSAEVNMDSVTRTEEKFDPEGQVMRSSTTDDENTETVASATNGGTPGVSANTAIDTNSLASTPLNNTKTIKKTSQSEYEINKTLSTVTQLAGGMKKLSAAVLVAAQSEGTGAARKIIPRTPEALEKLRRIVQSALGIDASDPAAKDLITLEELPFTEMFGQIGQPFAPENGVQYWIKQLQPFLYPGLALVVFGVFFLMLKRTPMADLAPAAETHGRLFTPGMAQSYTSGSGQPMPGHSPPAQPAIVTAEVFNQLMRENPDNMTHAIQSWLGRGKGNKS